MHITNTETRMGLIEDKALASRSRRGTTSLRVLYRSLGFALQTLAANVQRTFAQRQIGLSQLLSPWDGTEHKHSDTLTCAIVICEFLKIVFLRYRLDLTERQKTSLATCIAEKPRDASLVHQEGYVFISACLLTGLFKNDGPANVLLT